MTQQSYDLFIIGGGVNGCGIARDAAGRGLRVALAEAGDLGGATSSASTKLFHGGLRYLEYFEIRLVREALHERGLLLKAMPHIARPMRFVLPFSPQMRFDGQTPAARLLGRVFPWMKGRRPGWMIRLGLLMYDWLGGHGQLPGTRALSLSGTVEGAPLKDGITKGWEYSDCTVDDARLVVLNARAARGLGATVLTRTRVVSAERTNGVWTIRLAGPDGARTCHAKALVNAAGPWVGEVLDRVVAPPAPAEPGPAAQTRKAHVRLVRGSHIVVPSMFGHGKSYFLQGPDGRIIFAIPYRQDFTLIGTTDAAHPDPDTAPACTPAERDYLLAFANSWFRRQLTAADIVWTYSGVRPLYDDGASSATAATREYVLELDQPAGAAPLLNVFGGKITTYRRLAEHALEKLAGTFPAAGRPGHWTAGKPLPGGDFPVDGLAALEAQLKACHPFLDAAWAERLIHSYGTEAGQVLGAAVRYGNQGAVPLRVDPEVAARHRDPSAVTLHEDTGSATRREDLGRDFGASLTEAELLWLWHEEFARTAEDVVWRRSKLGLRLGPEQIAEIDAFMAGLSGPRGETV